MKKLIIILFTIVAAQSVFAQDTLYAFIDANQQAFIIHKVLPKQNIFRIAKYYKIKMADLKTYNDLQSDTLKVGAGLFVPVILNTENNLNAKTEIPISVFYDANNILLVNIIKPFYTNIPKLQKENDLNNLNFINNKKLYVGHVMVDTAQSYKYNLFNNYEKYSFESHSQTIVKIETDSILPKVSVPNISKYESIYESKNDLPEQQDEGTAISFFRDSSSTHNQFFALHNSIPIGTIIKVVNNVNNKHVFAKVIGRIPAIYGNKNCVLKLTPACATALQVVDERFFVKIYYH